MTGSTTEPQPRRRSASRLGVSFLLATLLYYWAGLELVPRVFSFGLFWPTWVFYAVVGLGFGIAMAIELIGKPKSLLDAAGSATMGLALGAVAGTVSLYVFTSILQEVVQLTWWRAFVWGFAGLVAGLVASAVIVIVLAFAIVLPALAWAKLTGKAAGNGPENPGDAGTVS